MTRFYPADRRLLEAMQRDYLAGVVPANVTRPLTHQELLAQTNFAELEREIEQSTKHISAHMTLGRQQFIALLQQVATQYAGVYPSSQTALAAYLVNLLHTGPNYVPGAELLAQGLRQAFLQELGNTYATAHVRMIQEHIDQNWTAAISGSSQSAPADHQQLDLIAQRLATQPMADVIRAAAQEAYKAPHDPWQALSDLSDEALTNTLARPAAHAATGLGRLGALADLPEAQSYYASELLDRSTCDRCEDNDGHEYDTLAEAKLDYPAGGYVHCRGGDRCRGTLVAVWAPESLN